MCSGRGKVVRRGNSDSGFHLMEEDNTYISRPRPQRLAFRRENTLSQAENEIEKDKEYNLSQTGEDHLGSCRPAHMHGENLHTHY